MCRGETTTDVFTIEAELRNPRAVQVTYRQANCIIIQKQLEDLDYQVIETEDVEIPYITQITCVLSQEETFQFCSHEDVLVQVRIIAQNGASLVSTIEKIKVEECLDNNILPLSNSSNI